MKILLINKFLHPKGGAETYVFGLGQALEELGHEVQYFGMEHPARIVGNRAEVYTKTMDFHNAVWWEKLGYGFRVVCSREARRKLRQVLADFQPDVCHLNNFHYQLTPSILLELKRWRRKHTCRVVYTAHDYQLVCPNHMCFNRDRVCEKCLDGDFWNCVRGKCIHGSRLKSLVGAAEGYFWNWMNVYAHIDTIVCCSAFLKGKLDGNPRLREKTVVMHNFLRSLETGGAEKRDYVLYFGRYSQEKGIEELVRAAKALPEIPFVFAGAGPQEMLLSGIPNVKNAGFQQGEALEKLVREARFTVCPSRWWENCPFSVLESLGLGTFVLGADMGGIPELIRPGENGELFQPGQLKERIAELWERRENLICGKAAFDSPASYCEKLLQLYGRKRVLYLTNIQVPYRVRFFRELAQYCDLTVVYERRRSCNRDVAWAGAEKGNYREHFLRSIPVGDEGGFSFGIVKEIRKGHDVIVVGCYNSPSQMLGILALRWLKIPYYLNFDGEPFLIPGEWKTPIKKFFLRGAAGYLTGGEQGAKSLRKVVDRPVVPYYFSSLSKKELEENAAAVCERGSTVLVAAQYLSCKGLDIALEAARQDKGNPWHFVGMGSRTGEFLRDFRGKIPENVRITPFLQKKELGQELRHSALLVLPSRRECWGLVVQEAASYGTPVVSTWGSGAAVEFLGEKYPQLLAKPGEAETLYRCICRVREENREEYAAFLKEKAGQYSIERSVKVHLETFGGSYGNGDRTDL